MKSWKKTALPILAGVAALLALYATPASATSTRTWVSGTGSDANSCTVALPCVTFAHALSVTSAGGEIDVLDAGDFGSLSITKSITIQAAGAVAAIGAVSTDGIHIDAGATDVVNLIGLQIGASGTTGFHGVSIQQAGEVHVVDCDIDGFTIGIDVEPTAQNTIVVVTDTVLRGNASGVVSIPNGPTAKTVLDHVTVFGAGTSAGGYGALSNGASSSVVVNNSTVIDNSDGLFVLNSGLLFTYGNNRVNFNGDNGGPNEAVLTQK